MKIQAICAVVVLLVVCPGTLMAQQHTDHYVHPHHRSGVHWNIAVGH